MRGRLYILRYTYVLTVENHPLIDEKKIIVNHPLIDEGKIIRMKTNARAYCWKSSPNWWGEDFGKSSYRRWEEDYTYRDLRTYMFWKFLTSSMRGRLYGYLQYVRNADNHPLIDEGKIIVNLPLMNEGKIIREKTYVRTYCGRIIPPSMRGRLC